MLCWATKQKVSDSLSPPPLPYSKRAQPARPASRQVTVLGPADSLTLTEVGERETCCELDKGWLAKVIVTLHVYVKGRGESGVRGGGVCAFSWSRTFSSNPVQAFL